jgi:hypothetical protein
LFVKLGENVVQFEVPKLFENFILAFNLRHEAIQVSVGKFSQV